MQNRQLVAITVPALLFILTGIVAVAVFVRGGGEPLGRTIAVGTLTSLIASMILSVVRVVSVVSPQTPPSHAESGGAVRARPKKSVSRDEWLDLLRTAKTEFYVAGHSLGRWCFHTNRDEFTSHIRRILDSGGTVTLVMLGPRSPHIARLHEATDVDYTGRINQSLEVLADLCAALGPAARARLQLSALTADLMLPYMIVGNEQRLVTATYLANTDSDDMLTLELERREAAGTAVYDDFHKLADAGVRPALPARTPSPDVRPGWARRSLRRLLKAWSGRPDESPPGP